MIVLSSCHAKYPSILVLQVLQHKILLMINILMIDDNHKWSKMVVNKICLFYANR